MKQKFLLTASSSFHEDAYAALGLLRISVRTLAWGSHSHWPLERERQPLPLLQPSKRLHPL